MLAHFLEFHISVRLVLTSKKRQDALQN